MADDEVDSLFSQKQAAKILGVSVRTLERHRVAGTGPRWARLGRLDDRFHDSRPLQSWDFCPQNAGIPTAPYDSNFGNARLVRYRSCDLLEWVEGNLRRSTSEMPPAVDNE
jgi:hypothetical protein